MQVSVIGTISFLKAVKKFGTYCMPAAVCDVNIHHTKELMLGNWRITVCDVASNSGLSVGSDVTRKCAQWVPKMLMYGHKVQCVPLHAENVH
jgi:hypothetical protein